MDLSSNPPQVSVIINCYNSAEFLHDALASVCAQTYGNWELIFWDNQSTDNSAEIFNSFDDPRFHYYRAEKHTTLGEARNLAVAKARGLWLAFLDCDDQWPSNKLEIQLQEVAQDVNKCIGFVYGPYQLKIENHDKKISAMERYYRRGVTAQPHSAKSIYSDLLQCKPIIIFSTVLLSREHFILVGGINPSLSQNEDYELLLKVAKISTAICSKTCCAIYRIHGMNNSHSNAELNYEEKKRIFESLPRDKLVKNALRTNYSRYGFFKISTGHYWDGLKMLLIQGSLLWVIYRMFFRFASAIRKMLS